MTRQFDKLSTRQVFGEVLLEKADEYDNLMYLAADTLSSVGGSPMQAKYPKRALNVGIAEQDMALMAAGMASCGAKVVAASYAAFCTMRMAEQVRSFICYPHLDVKVIGALGGLTGGQEGATHQGNEDVAITRTFPGIVVVQAADAASTRVISRAILDYEGPVYLRLGRDASATVFDDSYEFEIGKANVMKADGTDATVITAGGAVARAKEAVEQLTAAGYSVRLIEMPTIKPLDKQAIITAASETGLIVTAEDHSVIGGLGSAVAEVLAEVAPARLVRIGIDDVFTESGEHEELLDKYNLHPDHIYSVVEEAIKAQRDL